jgi:hypothetical protein
MRNVNNVTRVFAISLIARWLRLVFGCQLSAFRSPFAGMLVAIYSELRTTRRY